MSQKLPKTYYIYVNLTAGQKFVSADFRIVGEISAQNLKEAAEKAKNLDFITVHEPRFVDHGTPYYISTRYFQRIRPINSL